MIAAASSRNIVTTLLCLSGLVQSQVYPECPQTATVTEEDRDAIQATTARFLGVLEKFQNQSAEIVFVLDSSGRVGSGNFGCEVQFVRHFSKLFSVSEENTRIAVVTYSSCDKVYTDIDYITSPVGKNKCTFLGNDLPAYVTYRGGGTCTVEGLRRAKEILAQSRPSAATRMVFLLIAGHSNDGGSPLDVAQAMKDRGINIFTVGLGAGISVEELDAIASTPTDEYRFLVDQLTDVESLATKLRGDEWDAGSWDRNISPHLCNSLCSQGRSCCDTQATCSCAIRTGSYGCACRHGYKGDGTVGECQACPRGTYKDVYGNQECTLCPTLSTTAVEGSISRDACECLPGHEGTPKTGGSCTPKTCVQLTFSDASGVLVLPPNCGNHFGVECHLQCRENHRVQQGSADVQCLATGQWSAEPLICTRIKCAVLRHPGNGQLSCNLKENIIGTVCNLTCNEGYEPEGGIQTQCNLNEAQRDGQWSNTDGRCNAKTCPILLAGKNMKILPKSCEQTALEYTSICAYVCGDGFQVQGVKFRTCKADGQWSGSTVENSCVDTKPPEFTSCPGDISLPTDPYMSFATNPENWTQPEAVDNEGEPVIEASPSASQERFNLGVETVITYTARDKAGLESSCSFSVTVIDEEPPRVISCPNDIEEQSSNRSVAVFWEAPVFKDNSGLDLTVISKHSSGSRFSWGLPEEVWYIATDASENSVSCEFTVSLKQYECPFYPPPQYGALAYDNWLGGQFYRVSCNDNFDFNREPEELYYCRTPSGGDTAEWGPSPLSFDPANFRMPWPECTEKRDPCDENGFELNFFTGDCQANQLEIKQDFIQKLQQFSAWIPGFCEESMGCTVDNVEVLCGRVFPMTEDSSTPHCGHNNGGCLHVCRHTDKGAVCSCRDGYMLASDGKRCTDIDECDANRGRGACAHRCVNHDGGFQCSCNHGYNLARDGTSCTDIDECAANRGRGGCAHRCVNRDGGFQCSCNHGYHLAREGTSCIDIEPPEFTTCPGDISLPTDPHQNFTTNPANWDQPEARDNDGEPVIGASPSATQQRFYLDEVTVITYTARDETGLESTCTFSVTVIDEEPPQVISCPDDFEKQTSNRSVTVFWEKPVFKDNSGQDLRVISNRPSGSIFSWGLPEEVWYIATDAAAHNVSCQFTVSVKQYGCPFHPPPRNGALACDTWLGGHFCRVSCNDNFDFNREPEELYYCRTPSGGDTAEWGPSPLSFDPANFRMPWPDCTELRVSSGDVGVEFNYYTGDCHTNNTEIKEGFVKIFQTLEQIIPRFCSQGLGCTLENVEVSCGQVEPPVGHQSQQAPNISLNDTVDLNVVMLQSSTDIDRNRTETEVASGNFLQVLEGFRGKPAEIVFILDSSDNVDSDSFVYEVKFARDVSTIFSLSAESSRVAVVTYFGCHQINVDVDYITSPVGKNKCTLFGSDFQAIRYREGKTCTVGHGGLLGARLTLEQSRDSIPKLVFMLTNSQATKDRNLNSVASFLKASGVTIFVIAMGSGVSLDLMNQVASTPTEDHFFLLHLLGDVQRLATGETGDEETTASWDPTTSSALCDSLCSQGRSCCDAQATCSCATQTGSYGCACHPGYTGGGQVGECDACPRGTYKPEYGNQDCTSCPDLSTTAVEGSISQDACECLPGHEGTPKSGDSCARLP